MKRYSLLDLLGLLVVLAVGLLAGCSRQFWGISTVDELDPANRVRYEVLCDVRGVFQKEAELRQQFLPSRYRAMRVDGRTPSEPIGALDAVLTAIVNGTAKRVVITGRGGLGKTRAAEALEARLCAMSPVLRLEVRQNILPVLEGRGPDQGPKTLVEAIGSTLDLEHYQLEDVIELLQARPWVLLVDSLDEAPPAQRGPLLDALDQLLREYPNGKVVVHSRAPLVDGEAVLARFGTRISLLPLTCDDAERRVAGLAQTEARLRAIWATASEVGLLRQSTHHGQCVYPHMATWRDLEVAIETLLQGDRPRAATRAAVYSAWLHQLTRPLGGVLSHEQAVALVDRLVAAGVKGRRDFTIASCTAQLSTRQAARGNAKSLCSSLLSSPLFRKTPFRKTPSRTERDTAHWRLVNESVVDYFVARALERAVQTSNSCAPIRQLAATRELGEVASFLLGMPGGAECVGPVTEAVCAQMENAPELALMMDQGLAAGQERSAQLPGGSADACKRDLIEDLRAGITFRAQGVTGAPLGGAQAGER